ncbi:MAG: UDP-3-O-(3-hydroxymyristoyl)glucosamine N-acyltransferase [Gammaproteobacteria bacterium]|nr:UDP-3-O-(3-hydroxymyristoyl)glucosamine N-acyltransferase [Gammaproteobacteria bacterium]
MATSLGDLAAAFGFELAGDPGKTVTRIANLRGATSDAISFLANPALRDELQSTQAGAVIVASCDADICPVDALIADDPYLAYARVAAALHPEPDYLPGVHDSAVIDSSAEFADTAHIAANAVVAAGSRIGEHVVVGAGSYVGPRCSIGDRSRLIANVTLVQDATLGKRNVIHPGAVIGAQGFGNAMGPDGWVRIPQIGGVRLGDDVEIGANTTIDRGAIDDTVIGNGVRLDNLIQIAHNVRIGDHTAMAAMTGISGSTVIGKRCRFAGQSGTFGHIRICDDAIIGAAAVISKDVREPGLYSGYLPAEPDKGWKRKAAWFRRIDKLARRVSQLEKSDKP